VPAIRLVSGLFAADAVAIFVTYWRLPPAETYHVSLSGFDGGGSRVLVFLCFPTALVAIGVLGLVVERLRGRWAGPAAAAALVLCASVAWPGVVDEADLDAKWSNAFAAVGVLIVIVLSFVAQRESARPAKPDRWRRSEETGRFTRRGDRARLAIGVLAMLMAAPWIAAELGFFLDDVPVLGSIFITGKIARVTGGGIAPAVHHGHHHGLDGLLLALVALVLSRELGTVRGRRLRALLGGYFALMLVYGLTNMVNDGWDEQLWKRGWTDWLVPDVVHPSASLAWAAMLVAAGLIYSAFLARRPLLGRR
jgi:hypothetical protein